jgi:DNA-binding response OmpR family regulator
LYLGEALSAVALSGRTGQETPYHAFLVESGTEALKVVGVIKPGVFLVDYRLPDVSGTSTEI